MITFDVVGVLFLFEEIPIRFSEIGTVPRGQVKIFSGAERVRTVDLRLAKPALSQLSYSPVDMVGLGRFELPTSRLSGVRSNQLSYRPGRGDEHVCSLPQNEIVDRLAESENSAVLNARYRPY